jgi:hypothetical protein
MSAALSSINKHKSALHHALKANRAFIDYRTQVSDYPGQFHATSNIDLLGRSSSRSSKNDYAEDSADNKTFSKSCFASESMRVNFIISFINVATEQMNLGKRAKAEESYSQGLDFAEIELGMSHELTIKLKEICEKQGRGKGDSDAKRSRSTRFDQFQAAYSSEEISSRRVSFDIQIDKSKTFHIPLLGKSKLKFDCKKNEVKIQAAFASESIRKQSKVLTLPLTPFSPNKIDILSKAYLEDHKLRFKLPAYMQLKTLRDPPPNLTKESRLWGLLKFPSSRRHTQQGEFANISPPRSQNSKGVYDPPFHRSRYQHSQHDINSKPVTLTPRLRLLRPKQTIKETLHMPEHKQHPTHHDQSSSSQQNSKFCEYYDEGSNELYPNQGTESSILRKYMQTNNSCQSRSLVPHKDNLHEPQFHDDNLIEIIPSIVLVPQPEILKQKTPKDDPQGEDLFHTHNSITLAEVVAGKFQVRNSVSVDSAQ